ncbi:MAG: rod shape-determining protein RodA [Coriobacteriaceae bacterium]|nr:rod shape-determining protein RodA [Coriobacteriaceae bacterium]
METSLAARVSNRVNWTLLAALAVVVVYGTVMVRSATAGMSAGDVMLAKQFAGMAIGGLLLLGLWFVDYHSWEGWMGPLYWGSLFLVISPRIPGLGDAAKGATSWLQIAGVRLFQPSEPAKLLLIIVLAHAVSRYKGDLSRPADVARVLGQYVLVPLALILAQPDLGTGLVFVAIAMGILLVGGLQGRWFVAFALVGVVATGVVLQFGLLQEYQEDRLLVFIDPTRDPHGAGYNLQQSKIAIGSGGLTGRGLGSGTQSNLLFLPERHTDFIFSVIGEELGFLGALALLAVYLGLLFGSFEVCASSRDLFGALVVIGVMSMWTFQILVNIGMTVGIMPITGIPLPFMSYGASSLVTNLASAGILLSVWSRRYGV